jgi:hypothetical protein
MQTTPSHFVAPHLRNKPVSLAAAAPVELSKTDPRSLAPETFHATSRLGAAVLGATAVLGIANQAAAQEPPLTSFSVRQEDEDGVSFGFSQTNDSLPSYLEGLAGRDEMRPDGSHTDDDGWTAELRFDVTRTRGNTQEVGTLRYSMLTEKDAWAPGPGYGGRRADLGEVAFQRNTRRAVNDRLDVVTGIGGGLQASGDLGGLGVQEWWHINGGFGGRTGDALQRNYSTSDVDFAPLVTGGIGADLRLNNSGTVTLRSSVQGNLALGPGISSARSELGLEVQPRDWLTVEAGAKLDAVYASSNAYHFADLNGVRPGYYAQAQARVFSGVQAFARVEDGGFRDEPVYTVGFRVGLGARPWLDPGSR